MKRWLACFMSVVMLFASFPAAGIQTVMAEEPEESVLSAGDEATPETPEGDDGGQRAVSEETAVSGAAEEEGVPAGETGETEAASANLLAANTAVETPKVGAIEVEIYYRQPKKNLSDSALLKVQGDGGLAFELKLGELTAGQKTPKEVNGVAFQYTTNLFDQSYDPGTNEATMQPYDAQTGQIYYSAVNLYNLPEDTYTLSVEDSTALPVKAAVELKDWSKRVEFKQESLLTGDVDRNGHIDASDYQAVLNAFGKKDAGYDLNGDGSVDVADLQVVQENMGKAVSADSAVITDTSKILDPNQVKLAEGGNASVTQGTIAELVDPASETVVKFEKGTPITAQDALEIPLSLEDASVTATQLRIVPNTLTTENAPTEGEVVVEYENGDKETLPFGGSQDYSVRYLTEDPSSGTIVVDLRGQTAIKKITIRVTATNKESSNLVEIGRVEFLNKTKDKIQEQISSIPTKVQVQAGDESATVTWEAQTNVTGYEVKMTFVNPKNGQTETQVKTVDGTTLAFGDLINFTEYIFAVQSVNGDWKSGYSEPVKATPLPKSAPDAPEGITAQGGYRQIKVAWSKEKNSQSYVLYYRKNGETEFTKVSDITGTAHTLTGLEDQIEYEFCVAGVNAIGEGKRSNIYRCATTGIEPPITPNYKLINTSKGVNMPTSHIAGVEYPSSAPEDAFDIVDDDYTSYWNLNSWDAGGFNQGKPSPIVTFDQPYEMNEMILVRGEDEPSTLGYLKIRYWDENNKMHQIDKGFRFERKISTNGKEYYRIRLDSKIKATRIQLNTALYWPGAPNAHIRIQELKFYYYDSLPEDVDALFADDLHIELKPDVTMKKVDELLSRVNTPDPVSGEYHPDRDQLLYELSLAESILNEINIDDSVIVDQEVFNNKDNNLKFSYSMNDFQPLGAAARAGDTITVYVGSDTDRVPQLVYTQFHAEAKAWSKTVKLKKGRNEITLEQIGGEDSERGGALYLRYPYSNASNGTIKVRVAGAVKTPYLNLTGVTDQDEAMTRIRSYVQALKGYVAELPGQYPADAKYPWDPKSSVLNVTEIMTDQMLLSVPATAVLSALAGDEEAQAGQLYQNSLAMEQIMTAIYNSKGLSPDITDAGNPNHWPFSRINIRYARMFSGAFMYAGGMHIGIEYGSVGGVVKGRPHTKQADGTMAGGNLYGWGIAHEIGHVTDQSNMVYGETSNNIVAQLIKTFDEKAPARADYKAIYQKVTSGTTGLADNVFTQLGMFWQLHLAYDDKANNLDDPDSFYGRMYQNYRQNKAQIDENDKPDKDNLLIRMASDTVQKDLSEYFEKWGLIPSENTRRYLADKGYPKEERAIYYLNDDARHKRMAGNPGEMADDTAVNASLKHSIENGKDSKVIQFELGVSKNPEKILGYEIIRNGEVVGFTTENTYTDTLSSMNNRVVRYEVVAYDNYLNKTSALALEPLKIQHDGSVAKTKWTLSTAMSSEGDALIDECESSGIEHPALLNLYDEDYTNIYAGTKTTGNAEITINLHENMPVVGFKYTAAVVSGSLAENTVKGYTIQVSEDGKTWKKATSGVFSVTAEQPSASVYFNEKDQEGANQMVTYRAQYVKIIANGASGITAAEFDIIGPPGDNVDLVQSGIGLLDQDFVYDPAQAPIRAGSLVFTGSYRGHPGFNAVLVKDQDGSNVVGRIDAEHPEGEAASIFMAKIPANGNIGEISDGTWIYWIDRDALDQSSLPKTVRAELYRVDNMETLAGQRLTSDTLDITLPENLPQIHLTNGSVPEE